jgi:hypothetical protein
VGGIVGIVSEAPITAAFSEALRCLCHGSAFEAVQLADFGGLKIGVCHRESARARRAWRPESGLGAVLYGWALTRGGSTRPVDPAWIVDTYKNRGAAGLVAMDGDFVVVVLDLKGRRLILANNRTGTIPVQYVARPGLFAFAPESKALHALLGTRPELDCDGLLEFVTFGHALRSRTLFRGCKLLEPASLVEVDLDSGKADIQKYWSLSFRPRRRWHEAEAADALRSTVLESLRDTIIDSPPYLQLLLTGGYDSRTILAGMSAIGRPPDLALTWGVADSIPGSDPFIARKIADDHQTPFRFLPYGPETFEQLAGPWARVSELGSDNLGNFAAGPGFLTNAGLESSEFLIGDQLLGTGGQPIDISDAVEASSGVPRSGLAQGVASIMRPQRLEEIGGRVRAPLLKLVDESQGTHPKDVQDFLGFHIRLARWLNAPCYFREPLVSVRRPLLLAPVIDLFEELPPRLRVDKRVLIAMIRRRMPSLAGLPRAKANSLIDWHRAFSSGGAAAGFFRNLLDDSLSGGGPLGDYVDLQLLRIAVNDYCSTPATPISRSGGAQGVIPAARRSLSRLPGLGRGLRLLERSGRKVLRRPLGPSTGRVLQRLALVSLFEREISKGLCGGSSGTGDDKRDVEPPEWNLGETKGAQGA